MKEKIIVEVDDREPRMDLIADINDVGIEFDRKRLKVGDYVYRDILVERKEINDFCSSILNGRIDSQVERMKNCGKECFLIVVGRIKDRTSEIHENCILGKMTSIVVKHKIPILFCDDDFQFLWLLENLIKKVEEKNEMS